MLDTDYEVLKVLGEGTFGKVYQARHRKSNELIAAKQIKLGSTSFEEAKKSAELQALKALKHPFIVRLRELLRSQRDGSLYYIFEYVDSDLCRFMKQFPRGIEDRRASLLIRQQFSGLTHMHQHNFFHRDIKPENILLDTASETIRIADLGQARSLRARPPFTDYVGTRWYRAPECLLRDGAYSSPVDVWASGLIWSELLRGSPLFMGTGTIDQLYKIFGVLGRGTPDDWPNFPKLAEGVRFKVPQKGGCGLGAVLPPSSPELLAFLEKVLALNPWRRPNARKCMEDDFFSSLPQLSLEDPSPSRSYSRASPSPAPSLDASPAPSVTTREDNEDEVAVLRGALERGATDRQENAQMERIEKAPTYLPTDLDLDAELDAILGGESPRVPARARQERRPPIGNASSTNGSVHFGFAPVARQSRQGGFDGAPAPGSARQASAVAPPDSPLKGQNLDELLDDLCADLGLEEKGVEELPLPDPYSFDGIASKGDPPRPCLPEEHQPLSLTGALSVVEAELPAKPTGAAPTACPGIVPVLEESDWDAPTPTTRGRPGAQGGSLTNAELLLRTQGIGGPGQKVLGHEHCELSASISPRDPSHAEPPRTEDDDWDAPTPVGSDLARAALPQLGNAARGVQSSAQVAVGSAPEPAAGEQPERAQRRTPRANSSSGRRSGSSRQKGAKETPGQPWTTEEATQLRRVVRKTIKRGVTDKEQLWKEVSEELGCGRAPRECRSQYARDYKAHKEGAALPIVQCHLSSPRSADYAGACAG